MKDYLIDFGVGCGGDEYEVRIEVQADNAVQVDDKTISINGAVLEFDTNVELI